MKDILKLFKVKIQVLYFLLLILRVLFNSILSYINKNTKVVNIFLKNTVKLILYLQTYLSLIFAQLLVLINLLMKKWDDKWNIVKLNSIENIKIVSTLLIKVIIIYIRVFIIEI